MMIRARVIETILFIIYMLMCKNYDVLMYKLNKPCDDISLMIIRQNNVCKIIGITF